jgi:hypothetical protein
LVSLAPGIDYLLDEIQKWCWNLFYLPSGVNLSDPPEIGDD